MDIMYSFSCTAMGLLPCTYCFQANHCVRIEPEDKVLPLGIRMRKYLFRKAEPHNKRAVVLKIYALSLFLHICPQLQVSVCMIFYSHYWPSVVCMTFTLYYWHPMKPPVQRSLLVACTVSLLDPKKQDHIAPRRYSNSAIV